MQQLREYPRDKMSREVEKRRLVPSGGHTTKGRIQGGLVVWQPNSLAVVGKSLTVAAEAVARRDQAAGTDHEVRVPLDERVLRVGVHGGHDGLQEAVDLVIGAAGGELGNPDRLLGGVVDVDEVLEETGGIGRAVPVDRHEVNGALAVASAQERGQPRDTLAGAVAVGDGGGADGSLAFEGVHELDVGGRGVLGREVGLACVVGLVEAEKMGRSGGDSSRGIRGPAGGVVTRGTPAHGHEIEVDTAIVGLAPVVHPRDVGTGSDEALEQGVVVVGQATLVSARRGGRSVGRRGRSRGGRARRSSDSRHDGDRHAHDRGGGGRGRSNSNLDRRRS